MAASDTNTGAGAPAPRAPRWLSAAELEWRLEEEVSRAERHGTELACLLVVIENLGQLADGYGPQLGEEAPEYMAGALAQGLRRFDAIGRPAARELALVLPGADGARAEVVARRALARLRAIKVEVRGERMALRIVVGLAAWQDGTGARELLESARMAARAGEPTAREDDETPSS